MAKLNVDVTSTQHGSGVRDAARDLDRLGDSAKGVGGGLRDTEGRLDSLGGAADRAQGRTGGLLTAVDGLKVGLGNLAAQGAAAAGQALLQLGQDAVDAASDLEQAMGGAQAVFGSSFPQIEAQAKSAAQSLGLSKSQYLELSTVLGAGLKNQGLDDFAGKTQEVVKLGADLAAQYGGSTKEAIEAIGSLMRGESDPIERYGVSIKESAVSAELAKNGLDKLEGSAKTQAEAQARLKLLFDQTKDAQGAFAREGDTLATSQQKLNAQLDDTKAALGERLLPAVTSVTQAFNNTLQGNNALGQGLQGLGAWIQSTGAAVMDRLKAGWQEIQQEFTKAGFTSDDLKGALNAAGQVASWLGDMVGRWLKDGVDQAVGSFRFAVRIAGEIRDLWNDLVRVGGNVSATVQRMSDRIGSFPVGPFGTVSSLLGGVAGAARDAWTWVNNLIGKLAELAGAKSAVGDLQGPVPRMTRSVLAVEGGGGWSAPVINVTPARPVINVSIDGLTLRSVIRHEVRAAVAASSSGGVVLP